MYFFVLFVLKYHYIRDEGSTNAIFDDLAVACKSLRNPDLHTNEETFVYVMQSWHPQVKPERYSYISISRSHYIC